jgi:hypothetical protein
MSDSLTRLRRELVTQSTDHIAAADEHRHGHTITGLAAHRGSLMAGTYAYALAAVLGQLAKDFGPQAGEEYAEMVDFMLINGDDDDMNADVAESARAEAKS